MKFDFAPAFTIITILIRIITPAFLIGFVVPVQSQISGVKHAAVPLVFALKTVVVLDHSMLMDYCVFVIFCFAGRACSLPVVGIG
jgi:hypothetical protein